MATTTLPSAKHAGPIGSCLERAGYLPGQTVVIKLGGRILEQPEIISSLAAEIATLTQAQQGKCVVVHGGGDEISSLHRRLGGVPKFQDGIRLTDANAMLVAEAVLAGRISGRLTHQLRQHSIQAVGLSGRSGILTALPARRLSDDYVGEVQSVGTQMIEQLCQLGLVPVIAPIANHAKDEKSKNAASTEAQTDLLGQPVRALNINADWAAAHIAGALQADHLLLLTDVLGVQDAQGDIYPHLTPERAEQLIDQGVISGGMIPKVRCLMSALAMGVRHTAWIAPAAPEEIKEGVAAWGTGIGS